MDKINALKVAKLPDIAKQHMISGIQKSGTFAGSLGYPNDPAHLNPYAHNSIYPRIQELARPSLVNGTIDICRIAAIILGIGAILNAVLIKKSDMPGGKKPTKENDQ